ncbi:hypothetical protein C488_20842 [Natrinema pellirubrum DSM 15624]|uniref:Uncharacterized protein n=1 Tax=Natrinema pellirubrum (strain DSM 15624 / CIP 106293 / JCM 10476 / NCIMB 786 / 157) TaxID=797303 RepID=L9Y521_NATP1|nr:hypothetical protein C488_20842 [Natrinema pellirubrum DSM 15624]
MSVTMMAIAITSMGSYSVMNSTIAPIMMRKSSFVVTSGFLWLGNPQLGETQHKMRFSLDPCLSLSRLEISSWELRIWRRYSTQHRY